MALRILIALLILAVPLELPGCGPFLPQAVFDQPGGPDASTLFDRGQLGILHLTYTRRYQVIAYRHLSGVGLNEEEAKAIYSGPMESVPSTMPLDEQRNPWLAARNKVPGVKPIQKTLW